MANWRKDESRGKKVRSDRPESSRIYNNKISNNISAVRLLLTIVSFPKVTIVAINIWGKNIPEHVEYSKDIAKLLYYRGYYTDVLREYIKYILSTFYRIWKRRRFYEHRISWPETSAEKLPVLFALPTIRAIHPNSAHPLAVLAHDSHYPVQLFHEFNRSPRIAMDAIVTRTRLFIAIRLIKNAISVIVKRCML